MISFDRNEPQAGIALLLFSLPPLAFGPVLTTTGGLDAASRLTSEGFPVSRIPGVISALCYGGSWIALTTAGGWTDEGRGAVIPLALSGLLYGGAVAGGVTQVVLDARATRRWRESQATAASQPGSGVVGPVLVPVIGPSGARGVALSLAF